MLYITAPTKPIITTDKKQQIVKNQYLKSTKDDMEIPFPSNCMYCPFGIGAFELLWLYKSYPERFNEWVGYEAKKLEANSSQLKNLGVSGKIHKTGEKKALQSL